MRPGRIAERHMPDALLSVEHTAFLHFVPVVIFALDPEDRHGWNVELIAHPLSEPDRGDRLEQRKHRPTKERGLLTGDDGDGAGVAKLGGSVESRLRSTAAALLRFENRGDGVALTRMLLGAGDCRAP